MEEEIMLTEKKKKALLFRHRKNYLDIELEAAFKHGLTMAGFDVDWIDIDELAMKIDDFNVEQYDLIGFDVQSNSLFCAGRRRAYMFERLFERAKDGALTMYACDVKMYLQPNLWDKGEDHRTQKRNVFNGKPIKVIASLDPSIRDNEKDFKKTDSIWMRKLHPESTLHLIEWIPFSVHTYGVDFELKEEYEGDKIRNFYYGMRRDSVARSLEANGINSEKDLVYGSISRSIKNEKVRKIDERVKKPFTWVKYAKNADNVIIPYEYLKSDYQITSRLLEANLFYKDKVIFDDRIADRLKKYATDKQLWYDKAEKSAKEIKALYE